MRAINVEKRNFRIMYAITVVLIKNERQLRLKKWNNIYGFWGKVRRPFENEKFLTGRKIILPGKRYCINFMGKSA